MTICTENCSQGIAGTSFTQPRSLGKLLLQSFQIEKLKAVVGRERQQLLEMSDDMLKDIGVTRARAIEEAHRSDLPANRLANLANGRC